MFKFLFGVAFGAAGYWAWQSFGRDLFGMGGDQETTYGGFSSTPPSSYSGTSSTSGGSSASSESTASTGSSVGGSTSGSSS